MRRIELNGRLMLAREVCSDCFDGMLHRFRQFREVYDELLAAGISPEVADLTMRRMIVDDTPS